MIALPLLALAAAASAPPVWFVCDGIDRPLAYVVGQPAGGTSAIATLDKRTGRATVMRYGVGRADPGAGKAYYALTRQGRVVGAIHAANPGMADEPQDVAPPVVTRIEIDGRPTECRWLHGTIASGVTARRGISVTREVGGLVYRSYDFSRRARIVRPDGVQRTTSASNEIRGGVERRSSDGRRDWRFLKDGWLTIVSVGPGGAGAIDVMRGGRPVQHEDFVGVATAR